MDGIQESSNQSDPSVSNASVSCVVALLGTLEDLSNGRGLSDENIEMLHIVEKYCIVYLGCSFFLKIKTFMVDRWDVL